MKLSKRTAAWVIAGHVLLWAGVAALPPGAGTDSARAQDAAAGNNGFKLAVVDLDQVLTRSEQWADHQEESQRLRDKKRRTLEKHEGELRVMQNDLDNLPPSAAQDAARRAIEDSLLEYRRARDDFDRQLRELQMTALGRTFNDINGVVTEFARQNGLDLVLKQQDLTVSSDQPAELSVIIATANVLYARDAYDITDAIVQALNARYPEEIKDK